MSVAGVFETISRLNGEHIRVHQDRCIMVRNRNANCTKCSDVCTSGCISMADGVIAVQQDKCVGCGTCATACPTGALEPCLPNDAALLARCAAAREKAGSVVIACGRLAEGAFGTYDPQALVEVVCLGRVDESLIAALAAQGAELVTLCCRDCGSCERVEGRYVAEQVCSTANELLGVWGSSCIAQIAEELPEEVLCDAATAFVQQDAPVSAAAPTSGQTDALESRSHDERQPFRPVHVTADGTLPHFIPDRRERLLDVLATIGNPAPGVLDVRLWGRATIDTARCTSCRACAVFCPTGAIRKVGEPGDAVFGIDHYPSDCVKCLCCESVCRPGAIRILDEVDTAWILTGQAERVEMRGPSVSKGGSKSILNSIRALSGVQEIFER